MPTMGHPMQGDNSGYIICTKTILAAKKARARANQYSLDIPLVYHTAFLCQVHNPAIECPTHWMPKDKIEGFILDKIRNFILTDENLIELLKLTNDELSSDVNDVEVQLDILITQINEVGRRLEHLYDALENGDFTSTELAPRIRKWEERKSELELRKQNLEVEFQSQVFEMPDLNQLMGYVNDLKVVLGSASILEQKAFLKSFVEEVQVGADEVTIHYTMPMPPTDKEEEKVSVLPIGYHGRPYRSRTCDCHIICQSPLPVAGVHYFGDRQTRTADFLDHVTG